jgi:molybdate transport system permease protein
MNHTTTRGLPPAVAAILVGLLIVADCTSSESANGTGSGRPEPGGRMSEHQLCSVPAPVSGRWARRAERFAIRGTVGILIAGAIVFVVLPIIALILQLPVDAFPRVFSQQVVVDALLLSLATATVSTAIVLAVMTPIAYVTARYAFPGREFVETLMDLPIVLPPAVAGLGLLLAFGRFGLVGQYLSVFGVTLAFTPIAVVMAQVFVASPFYLRQARTSFAELDPVYEAAARTLGASRLYAFLRVTVPLTIEGLVSGTIMTFARALGEFGATILFAGNLQGRTQTMPLAIYSTMQTDLQSSCALAVLLVAISFGVIAAVRFTGRRRRAA